MTRTEVIQRTSELVGDKDYIMVNLESYGIHVDTAFNEYNIHHPKRTSKEIEVNSINQLPYVVDLSTFEEWKKGYSIITGIEVKHMSVLSGYLYRGKYIRSNFWKVNEDDISLESNLELYFSYRGNLRVFYTIPYLDIEELDPNTVLGIIYLSAGYACISLASKTSMILENYIQSDRMTYDRRSKSFIETSKQFMEMAYRILDMPKGEKGYSSSVSVPYLERAKAARINI